MAMFKSQEARRQQALQARAAAVAEARTKAQAQVEQARQPSSKTKFLHNPVCRQKAEGLRLRSFAPFCNRRAKLRRVASDVMSMRSTHHAMHAPLVCELPLVCGDRSRAAC